MLVASLGVSRGGALSFMMAWPISRDVADRSVGERAPKAFTTQAILPTMPRKGRLERELEKLDVIIAADPSPSRVEQLRDALSDKQALVVARAAAVVREERITELEDALLTAYSRFLEDATKRDPGCHAKFAILEALDHLERIDPEPFLSATSYRQLEKAWGPPDDTAVGMRGRGALALARLQYSDTLLVLGRLLADPEPSVRAVAAQATAFHGRRDGAALLVLRLQAGETDSDVVSACIEALCRIAPHHARPLVDQMLRDEALNDLVAYAVVASESDEAIAILIDNLENTVRSDIRTIVITALGVSRRDPARTLLLTTIAEGNPTDAEACVRGLGVHSYDPRVAKAVRSAASKNKDAELDHIIEEIFPPTN